MGTKRRGDTRVEGLAREYLGWCERWGRVLERRPGLNDQVQRAAVSTLANLGEGLDADTLGQKRRYFRYALASTGEGLRLVRGARHARALPDHAADQALDLLRDIKWDLLRLIAWTRR